MGNYLPAILCSLREDIGLTREQAAKRIGISLSSLRQYELGIVTPRLTTVSKMAEVYQANSLVLLTFYPEKKECENVFIRRK